MRYSALLFVFLCAAAQAQVTAPMAYDPPMPADQVQKSLSAAAPEALHEALADVETEHRFRVFEGLNEALRDEAWSSGKQYVAARGFEVSLSGNAFFNEETTFEGRPAVAGRLSSADAYALRVLVDLSGLEAGEALWLVDPNGPRAFGPYTRDDSVEGGRWLPTVEGDSAVLIAVANGLPEAETPAVEVVALSHFFVGFEAFAGGPKQLSCNIPVACDADPDVIALASAVGIVVIPVTGFDNAVCSGTLINNPATAEREPYFITANHCVESDGEARQMDIIWDFRAGECVNPDAPPLWQLPRSNGVDMLATDAVLDMTLMELDSVPVGEYGRAYAGYTTDPAAVGDNVFGIHHPQGSYMRITYGAVSELDVVRWDWANQYEVSWTEGVTEPGSSGSGLFLDDASLYFVGCLSNGPNHSCYTTQGRVDYYAPFALFFDQAKDWLNSARPPVTPPAACPARTAFADEPETLQALRSLRDNALAQFPSGRVAIAAYYRAAPAAARLVEEWTGARKAFMLASRPAAWAGALLDYDDGSAPRD